MIRVHILVSCPLRLGQDLDGSGNPEKLCWEPQSARRSCQTSDDWVESLFFFFFFVFGSGPCIQGRCGRVCMFLSTAVSPSSVAVSARNYRLVSKSYFRKGWSDYVRIYVLLHVALALHVAWGMRMDSPVRDSPHVRHWSPDGISSFSSY